MDAKQGKSEKPKGILEIFEPLYKIDFSRKYMALSVIDLSEYHLVVDIKKHEQQFSMKYIIMLKYKGKSKKSNQQVN